MKKIVVALGGNALGKTPEEQLKLVKNTAKSLVDLVEEGYNLVVTHGNGPQVGMINLSFDYSHNNGCETPLMPFAECGAMSQGYIGYHLQQAIQIELKARNINKDCAKRHQNSKTLVLKYALDLVAQNERITIKTIKNILELNDEKLGTTQISIYLRELKNEGLIDE
jgi:hypothetical protein